MLDFVAGREAAFVELYHRYRDRIVNFTRRMLQDQSRAEDAAQEVFLKVYRARSSYQPQSRFSTFIYRVAANHCLNLRARVENRLMRHADVDHNAAPTANQHEALAHTQLRAALERALAELPERQRVALLLVHYEGLSYREAAEAIGVSESSLKALIHRARHALTGELSAFLEEHAEDSCAV